MPITEEQTRVLSLCKIKGLSWYLIAREAQRPGGLERLWTGHTTEESTEARAARDLLRDAASHLDGYAAEVERQAERAQDAGARLITVADEDYPTTLRLIFNLPPFLFVRGALSAKDLVSVAVVGTRAASPSGLQRAARLARLLSERDVTVVSGLARGIDTAAHRAALDAGGRTVAVVGTGILKCYPAENRALAEEIADSGAVVSQFWPETPGASYTFPRRNVTMSGIAQGTAVIEASATSGAKMQARLALEHGKKVFLLKSLVDDHEWARKYAERRGARVVQSVEDILGDLAPAERIRTADQRRAQLTIEFA